MRILPVIFSPLEIQAILDDRKSQFRQVVKTKYGNTDLVMRTDKYGTRLIERQNDAPPDETIIDDQGRKVTRMHLVACREVDERYKPGDILWVRETWGCYTELWECADRFYYRADFEKDANGYWYEPKKVNWCDFPKWRPSIFMPKAAARLFLRVTDIRVERLQDISSKDVDAEGCKEWGYDAETGELRPSTPSVFKIVWNDINAKRGFGWDANPWVWVISFERCNRPEGWPGGGCSVL